MGISIFCQKTRRANSLGYGGFARLRNMVAEKCASDPRFCRAYESLFETCDKKSRKKTVKTLAALIKKGVIHETIADFLFMSDTKGLITVEGCKEILKHLQDVQSDEVFGYAAWENPFNFNDFVAMLKECVENNSALVWE